VIASCNPAGSTSTRTRRIVGAWATAPSPSLSDRYAAVRLRLDDSLIQTEQLLIYRVLLRDQPAIADLVQSALGQLVTARGGAEPLLATLDAYLPRAAWRR
jgi:hypothetical protein